MTHVSEKFSISSDQYGGVGISDDLIKKVANRHDGELGNKYIPDGHHTQLIQDTHQHSVPGHRVPGHGVHVRDVHDEHGRDEHGPDLNKLENNVESLTTRVEQLTTKIHYLTNLLEHAKQPTMSPTPTPTQHDAGNVSPLPTDPSIPLTRSTQPDRQTGVDTPVNAIHLVGGASSSTSPGFESATSHSMDGGHMQFSPTSEMTYKPPQQVKNVNKASNQFSPTSEMTYKPPQHVKNVNKASNQFSPTSEFSKFNDVQFSVTSSNMF